MGYPSNNAQFDFSSGSVSPMFWGRRDLDAWKSFLRDGLNMQINPSGAIQRRPGTLFLGAAKFNNRAVTIQSFQVSKTQTLALEIGHLYVRFWINDALVMDGPSVYEVVTPFEDIHIGDLAFAQKNDVLFITHPDFAPRRLNRFSQLDWTLTTLTRFDGPYDDINTEAARTLTVGSALASLRWVITSSLSQFVATDVTRHLRLQIGGLWYWGVIEIFTNATTVTVDFSQSGLVGGTTSNFRMGAWSNTLGWPNHVTLFDNRLYFANSKTYAQSFWSTYFGTTSRFSPTERQGSTDIITELTAITGTLSGERPANIRWMRSFSALFFGTDNGIYSSISNQTTPADFQVSVQTEWPAASVKAVTMGGHTLYLHEMGRTLYSLLFSEERGGYASSDISVFWKHLLSSPIEKMTTCAFPLDVIWLVDAKNDLFSVGFKPDQQTVNWMRCRLAGDVKKIHAATGIRRPDLGRDTLYLAIDRMVNNVRITTIERMAKDYNAEDHDNETQAIHAEYCDSSKVYEFETDTSALTGLAHLEGQQIVALVDGIPVEGLVVVGGSVTLPIAGKRIVAGYPYYSGFKTIDVEGSSPKGPTIGLNKNAHHVCFQLYQSYSFYVAPLGGQGSLVQLYGANIIRSDAFEHFTGVTDEWPLDSGNKREQAIEVWTTQPLPLTILGIYYRVDTKD